MRGSRELQDDVPPKVGTKPDASIDRRSADDKIDNSDFKESPHLSLSSAYDGWSALGYQISRRVCQHASG